MINHALSWRVIHEIKSSPSASSIPISRPPRNAILICIVLIGITAHCHASRTAIQIDLSSNIKTLFKLNSISFLFFFHVTFRPHPFPLELVSTID